MAQDSKGKFHIIVIGIVSKCALNTIILLNKLVGFDHYFGV